MVKPRVKKQRRDKVVSTLFQCYFNIEHRRFINVVQRCKADVAFCFISDFVSTLIHNVDLTLKVGWDIIELHQGKYYSLVP